MPLTFDQSCDIWTSWRLFDIIVKICEVHFETLLFIFKVNRNVRSHTNQLIKQLEFQLVLSKFKSVKIY